MILNFSLLACFLYNTMVMSILVKDLAKIWNLSKSWAIIVSNLGVSVFLQKVFQTLIAQLECSSLKPLNNT